MTGSKMKELRKKFEKTLSEGEYQDLKCTLTEIPDHSQVKQILEDNFQICSNREFRVVLVEDFGDYKIFIQMPDGKSECDFFVWWARFKDGKLQSFDIPTHKYLGNWYIELKENSEILSEHLMDAVVKLIKNRKSETSIVEEFLSSLDDKLKSEVMKFLSTLKWVALQEDVNYPPPKLGSKFTLAVYVLLDSGLFKINEIVKILKLRG